MSNFSGYNCFQTCLVSFLSYFIGVYTNVEIKQIGWIGTYPVYNKHCSNICIAAKYAALTTIFTTHVSIRDPRGWNVYM
jgi:hypothetical protein